MKILNTFKPELSHPQANPLKEFYQSDKPFIFLLRHGQIQNSNLKRFIGDSDVLLDEIGLQQADYWGKAFSLLDLNTIYSSSLKRCCNTAEFIANKKQFIKVPELNEISMGTWDGKTFDEIKKSMPEEFEKRGKQMDRFCPRGGESFQDLKNRVLPFFDAKIKNKAGHTLVVTHAGVMRVILCRIMGLSLKDLFKIRLHYGQVFVISSKTDLKNF